MKEKEWYEGVSCGYVEGTIDEIIEKAEKGVELDRQNRLAICDLCSFSASIGILTGISGTENITVVHGPTGCAQLMGSTIGARYVTTTSREDLHAANYFVPYFVCSGMEELDVVYGGIDKLRRAILYTWEKWSPKLITVLTTCSTQIICDDVMGLIEDLRGKVKAHLIYLPTSGLDRGFNGYDVTYKALIDELVVPVEEKEKIDASVNIIADKRRTGGEVNFAEIARVLKKLGIKINCRFVRNVSIDDIKNLAKAHLNLMMCHNAGIPTARYLKEKFGIPYFEYDYPMGLDETLKWYNSILELLNIEDKDRVLEKEYHRDHPRFEEAKRVLKGKRIACIGAPGRMVRYMDLIHELQMEPVYLSLYFHLRDIGFHLLREKLKKYDFNPHIVIQGGFNTTERNLSRLKPDIMFGDPGDSHFAFRKDIAFCHLESAPQSGFSGTLNIAERWADALRRPVYDFWHRYTEIPSHFPKEL